MHTAWGGVNLYAAWLGIILGILAGALQGLRFHRDDWLQGYGSWPRRMMRLGHISFFGIAFVNLAFAVTANTMIPRFSWTRHVIEIASWLFIVGAITMPLICYLAAYKKPFRHLFFIPVSSLLIAACLVFAGIAYQ